MAPAAAQPGRAVRRLNNPITINGVEYPTRRAFFRVIAQRFGFAPSTVALWHCQDGIGLDEIAARVEQGHFRGARWTAADARAIADAYAHHVPIKEIARRFGTSKNAIVGLAYRIARAARPAGIAPRIAVRLPPPVPAGSPPLRARRHRHIRLHARNDHPQLSKRVP
jgi:hypothetical protein